MDRVQPLSDISNNGTITYAQYIHHMTPLIVQVLQNRGWTEEAKNKVQVRNLVNAAWRKLSAPEW